MLRVITVSLLLLATGGPAAVQDRLAHPAVDLRGTLYRAVFVSAAGPLSDPDLAALPEDLRARLSRFLIRQGTLERASGTPLADPRRIVERAIVALVERDDAQALAADFLSEAPLAAEWGDGAEAPLREAGYAEFPLRVHRAAPARGVRAGGSRAGPRHDEDGCEEVPRRHAAGPIRAGSNLRAARR